MFDFLLTEEEKKIKEEAREFTKSIPEELVRAMDEDKVKFPTEFLEEAGRRNLLGLRFGKEYGGREASWVAEMAAIEEIGVLGSSLACLYSLVSIVGEAIHEFGTDYQKETYLVPTIKGELYCAEALTEPRGGSDFFGATTHAEKKGDYYILNGQKRFVVGAEGADYFIVYAKTRKDAPPERSLSLFIVERDMGVRVEKVYGLMGTRGGGTGRIVFKDVKVPAKNLVGEENKASIIFHKMMVPERLTSAAGALGLGYSALKIAAKYSMRRKAFGKAIQFFQGVNFKVADSISLLDAARSLVYTAARFADTGAKGRRLISEAKKIATDFAYKAINDAMQIMGGIGYTNIFPIEKYLRDARLTMIWTGTNEIMNLIIQHEYYREVKREKGTRDIEKDAVDADSVEEIVYE